MASIGKPQGQPPEPESQAPAAPRLLPPADVPPPHSDSAYVVLLDVLRRRVQGSPTWMLPRYVVHDVDIYRHHPEVLLQGHPSATSPDGKRAWYFINLVRPLTATDTRRSRVVPGGFWKSERAPVPVEAAPDRIVGSKQSFSFVSKEAEDKDGVRGGFIMYELVLPGQAGRLAGGDELALSKIFPTPRVDKKRPQGQGSIASARRSAAASSAPAPTSSAPHLLQRPGSTRRSGAASSPPPLWQAPASSAPPSRQAPASSLALQGTASSAPGPASSSQPPIQGPASSPPYLRQPPPRQGAAKRVLLLEVGDSPPREGKNFSCHHVYRAMELLGPGKRVAIDCGDMFLLDSGKGKRQRTVVEF